MYLALKRAKVTTELHVYAQGGHGFGVRKSDLPCSSWPDRCIAWLRNLGMLGTDPRGAAVASLASLNLASSANDWTAVAPREEIRPQFQHADSGGKSGHGGLIIRADEREGLHGWWQKTFNVTPGQHYHISAWRRAENVAVPRRSVLARVLWRDDAGKEIQRLEGVVTNFSLGVVASAEPEYPRDVGATRGGDGWVEMSGVYQAPAGQPRRELNCIYCGRRRATGRVERRFFPVQRNRRAAQSPPRVRALPSAAVRKRRWTPAANSRHSSRRPRAVKPTWSCWAKP